MKLLLVFLVGAIAAIQGNEIKIDFSAIKPLHEIPSYRAANPRIRAPATASVHSTPFNSRIVNGEIASPSDVPYQAGIILNMVDGTSICGGSLLSAVYVLTSASCFLTNPTATVILDASDISNIGDIIPVSRVIPHEFYSLLSETNDIALAVLSRPPTFGPNIQIARLPLRSQANNNYVGEMARVSGWGTTSDSGNQVVPVNNLRFVSNPVITNLICTISFPAFVTGTNICTSTDLGTPCVGDQGSPLTVVGESGPVVIGIHAYTFSLGCEWGWPAVYTRVGSYLNWIQANSDLVIL